MYNLLLLLIILAILVLGHISSYSVKFREGYESITNCVAQGYPRSFCLKGPIEH